MKPIIEVENLSKQYKISKSRGGYVTLRDTLTNVAKRPFRFAKQKTKKVMGKGGQEEFWALKDINFSVEQGEVLGVIGANGTGKSTLLKILSRITPPTHGRAVLRGRVSSLLEVGTGFNPELTGRENIFLNGAILGMKRQEIIRKFDDIVEFSGVEKFIDTPVKRYSSGMNVRLAFAVAAHLEPEILLIDEVLAVGDAEFQKRCLGKMKEVTRQQGRTILFVSHNMVAIKKLCKRCLLLESGSVQKHGKPHEVVSFYINSKIARNNTVEYKHKIESSASSSVFLISATLTNEQGKPALEFGTADDINISIKYEIKKKLPVLFIDCYLYDESEDQILHSTDNDGGCPGEPKEPGTYVVTCKIPKYLLNVGRYFVSIGGRIPKIEQFFSARHVLSFQINSTGGPTEVDAPRQGVICPKLEWIN